MRQTAALNLATARVGYIDGMRGSAALLVMLFHIFWEVFGQLLPYFRSNHLRFLLGGHLHVCIFFILSGDALATPFLATGRISVVVTTAVRRYTRLVIPITMVCVAVYLLMALGLVRNHEVAALGFRPDWLGIFLDFQPSFRGMLAYATFGVFGPTVTSQAYHPFLWTMPIEMLGSILVVLFLFLKGAMRNALAVCAATAGFMLVQQSYLGLFFIGILLAMLRCEGRLDRLAAARFAQATVSGLLLAAYLTYCYVLTAKDRELDPVAAAVVVTLLYLSYPARRLFELPISKFLGKISFALYLVHFAVIVSFTSAGTIYLHSLGCVTYGGALLVGTASALLSLALAWAFAGTEARLQKWTNQALDRWVLNCI